MRFVRGDPLVTLTFIPESPEVQTLANIAALATATAETSVNGEKRPIETELPAEVPEESMGWRTVVGYAAVSVVMLLLAVGAYTNYVQEQQTRSELAYQRAQMTRTAAGELRTLLEKQTHLQEARDQVAVLGREIVALPTVPPVDKSRLYGTVSTIDHQLGTVQSLIDQARVILSQFEVTTFQEIPFLALMRSAFGDTPNTLPPEAKYGIALGALLLIVIVILYCLWMIARPAVSNADKKWAKEVLNRQLVFLGGLVVGIVIK